MRSKRSVHTFSPELVTTRRPRHPRPGVSLPPQVSDANGSCAASAKSVPEERDNQRPAKQEKLTTSLQAKCSKEEQPERVEKAEGPEPKGADPEPNKEVGARPDQEQPGPNNRFALYSLKVGLCLYVASDFNRTQWIPRQKSLQTEAESSLVSFTSIKTQFSLTHFD